MNKDDTTVIHVGEHIRIGCGPKRPTHAGRLWRIEYDGKNVDGLVDLCLFGPLDDLGLRSAHFRKTSAPLPEAIEELRAHGWNVVVDDAPESPVLRAVVLDENDREVPYAEHQDGVNVALAEQAAHAAFWWHVERTHEAQAKRKRDA